jgi:tetratricopeptide (TPR) repeat protein
VSAAQNRADAGALVAQAVSDPSQIAVMRGDFNRAVQNDAPAAAYYQAALRDNPASSAAWYGLGEIALRAEQWPAAVAHFEAALRLAYPRDALAHGGLARAYYEQGLLDEAQARIEAALGAVNDRIFFYDADSIAGLHRTAGWIALEQGRFVPAQAAFAEALRNDGRDAESHLGLALVRRALDDAAGAAAALTRAVDEGLPTPLPPAACAAFPALAGCGG